MDYKNLFAGRQYKWLVTGCAGFIGSHLVETLLRHNQLVVGVDNLSTGFYANLDAVRSNTIEKWNNFTFILGDLTEIAVCSSAIHGVDFVLHNAALGSVPRSMKEPLLYHANNVGSTVNMLEASRLAGVKKFIYASSSSVYGDIENTPFTEKHIGNPLSPYAASKQMCEIYAAAYSNAFDLTTVGLRYFNVFGPRANPHGEYANVIPKWIHAIMNNDVLFINGDGSCSRDYCHVDNVVQANIRAALAEEKTDLVFNVACGQTYTLLHLYEMIRDLFLTERIVNSIKLQFADARKGDMICTKADISNIVEQLSYTPNISLHKGLIQLIHPIAS